MTCTRYKLADSTDKLILDYCNGKDRYGRPDWSEGWAYFGKEVARLLEVAVYQDDDVFFIFDGHEGAGKSLFMRKTAALIHRLLIHWNKKSELSTKNIHMTVDEYTKASLKAKYIGHVNILDEARRELNRATSQSITNRKYTDYISECRDTNQIHMVGLPSFHDLDKNLVLFRQKFIIHVKKQMVIDKTTITGTRLERGKFVCYMRNRDLINSYFSKSRYTYPKKYAISGVFDGIEPIEFSMREYKEQKKKYRKEKYRKQREKELGKRQAKKENQLQYLPDL